MLCFTFILNYEYGIMSRCEKNWLKHNVRETEVRE